MNIVRTWQAGWLSLFLLYWCCIAGVHAAEARTAAQIYTGHVTVQGNTVNIALDNLHDLYEANVVRFSDEPIPLKALSVVVGKYPRAMYFKVTWNFRVGPGQYWYEALYNRRHRSVEYRMEGCVDESSPTERVHWRYRHVMDAALCKAAVLPGKNTHYCFDALLKAGCKRYKMR